MATATSKEYLKNSNNESLAEELKNELAEQEEEMQKVNQFFTTASEDDSDLLRQLDELSLNEKPQDERERILAEMQKEEAAILDQQLAEWD